jgi:hypothetical protein
MGNIIAAAATGGERPAAAGGERRGSDYAERYSPNRQRQTEHFAANNEVFISNYFVRSCNIHGPKYIETCSDNATPNKKMLRCTKCVAMTPDERNKLKYRGITPTIKEKRLLRSIISEEEEEGRLRRRRRRRWWWRRRRF